MIITKQTIICGVIQQKDLSADFPLENLFNSYSFHINNKKEEELFTFFVQKGKKVICKVLLVKANNVLKSTSYSPFSFFEGIEHIDLLFSFIVNWAKENDVNKIILKTPPFSYHSTFNFPSFFEKHSLSIVQKDVNFFISINQKSFRSKIAPASRNKLNKCIKAGFTFEQSFLIDYEQIFKLIKGCRDDKSYELSMNSEALKRMIELYPKNYFLFVVKNQEGEIIASSVVILVSSKVLYTFYWGDNLAYRSYSPVIFLLQGIYEYCQIHQIELMDLGTSSLNGVINQGSYNFKKNIGGVLDKKVIVQYLI